jgi:HlyD family secretion protein
VAVTGGFLRRRIFWWLAAGVAGLGVAGLLWGARARKPRYVTAVVTRGSIQRSVSATGALNPVVTVQVGSYVSGTLKSLACDYNTEVVVGQVCATIDPVPFQLIVAEDQAQVGTAVAQLKKDQAALVYAKTAFERDSKLVVEGTVSQDTVDSEKSVYDQGVAQIGLDQASIAEKRAALQAADVNLAYTNIKSPVVGTVITRSIDVGQTVAASLQSPTLFLIGKDLTQMQVDTNVSEADVGDVRVGQGGFFTVQAFPGRTFRGKVVMIRHGPITVQNVVTYDIVLAVPNPDRALFPGMTADTHVVIDEHADVLRVPLPAVRFNPEGLSGLREAPSRGALSRPEARGEGTTASAPEERGQSATANESRPEGGGPGRPEGRTEGRAEGRGERGSRPRGEGRPERQGGGRGSGRRSEHRSQVWVLLENGELKAVPVTTGIDDGALIEVSGQGLKPGDRVVVNAVSAKDSGADRRGATTAPNQGQAFRPPGPRL